MSFQQEEARVPTYVGRIRLILEDRGPEPEEDAAGAVYPQYRRFIEIEVKDQYKRRIGDIRVADLDAFITAQRKASMILLQENIRAKAEQEIIIQPQPEPEPQPEG